jgi:hypothetical protein
VSASRSFVSHACDSIPALFSGGRIQNMATAARTRTLEMKNKVMELQRVVKKGEKDLKVTNAKIKKLKAEQVSLKGRLASLAKKLK